MCCNKTAWWSLWSSESRKRKAFLLKNKDLYVLSVLFGNEGAWVYTADPNLLDTRFVKRRLLLKIIRLPSLWWSPHLFLTSSFCCRVDILQDEGTPASKKRGNFDKVQGYYGHVTKSQAFGERSKGLKYWVLISHLFGFSLLRFLAFRCSSLEIYSSPLSITFF